MVSPTSNRVLVASDALGLLVLAVLVALLVHWLVPDDGYRVVSGTLSYLVLAGMALSFWHHDKLSQRALEASHWIRMAGASLLLGGLSLCFDILIGSVVHPGSASKIEAASRTIGPLGIGLTLLISPGLTVVALAGLVRSLAVPKGAS